jgi:hypothetical protein
MLRPIIMIGCGGSGQKAVRYVRDAVKRHLEHRGWEDEFPKAWQFIGIDTLTTQEDPSIPFLPQTDYVSVSLKFNTYQGLSQAIDVKFGPDKNPRGFKELQGWRPNPAQVKVPLKEGAGQLRAVGRMAGILALQDSVRERLKYAFTQCEAGGPELSEVSRHLGVQVPSGTTVPDPITIIVGSMAGGTGAGIMLDVIDLVRRTHVKGAFPVLVAFTPDIFGSLKAHTMTANSAAFVAEMLSGYWDDENTDNVLIPETVSVDTRGAHSIFMIGRTNLDGLDLQNSNNVYRAVGETLAAVTTSSEVQTDFMNFVVTNWPVKERDNNGGFGFHSSRLKGVASSFGSATISIGRDRFRDYLKKLLHRSIVEHLADGYESVANSVLGEASKSMAGPAKVAELARREIDSFIVECGLNEGDNSSKQISNQFVSNDIIATRIGVVANKIKAPFPPALQQAGGVWWQTLSAQAQQVRALELSAVDSELSEQLREWGSELLQRVLRTSTEYAGKLSLPVLVSLLQSTRSQVLQSAAKFRESAKEASGQAEKLMERARGRLAATPKGSLPLSAAPIQETIQDFSKAIVAEWSARVRERLSVALESVATSMLSNIEASVSQSMARIDMLTKPQDGKPAAVSGWPKNDGVVPNAFTPSPVEFFLEDYSTWPTLASRLLAKSLGDPAGLPIDPVEAARLLLIRGGFGGDGRGTSQVTPLIWADSHGQTPVWEPGQQVSIVIQDDLEPISERIDAWLMRPATEMLYVLSEGLSSYLMPVHYKTGAAIPDHQQRLATFRKSLSEALTQSRPLMEVDEVMLTTVHPMPIKLTLNIQGFPFGEGHPARRETEQIIQSYLKTAEPVTKAFSSGDAESVLVTSFLEYPVNPSVVTSFTKPLAEALQHYDADGLKAAFWNWRRARILENFIPLPDDLRIAAIRGFAVARILGLVTCNPSGGNQISTIKGVYNFPKHFLTETDAPNVLPCLLESMILAFADAPTRGKAAFDAYGALIDYGTGGGTTSGFKIDGVVEQILRTGDYRNISIVDQSRASTLGGSPAERIANAKEYLNRVIGYYDELDVAPLDPMSWRSNVGSVEPPSVMSRELLNCSRRAYLMVRDAFDKFELALAGKQSEVAF